MFIEEYNNYMRKRKDKLSSTIHIIVDTNCIGNTLYYTYCFGLTLCRIHILLNTHYIRYILYWIHNTLVLNLYWIHIYWVHLFVYIILNTQYFWYTYAEESKPESWQILYFLIPFFSCKWSQYGACVYTFISWHLKTSILAGKCLWSITSNFSSNDNYSNSSSGCSSAA